MSIVVATIVLKHLGGETREVEVLDAASAGVALWIRWGMAGLYKLDLKKNFLYGARSWHAADRQGALRIWGEITGYRKQAIGLAKSKVKCMLCGGSGQFGVDRCILCYPKESTG